MKRIITGSQTGINAVTASVTYANASKVEVKNARKISAMFTRADHSSGSGAYEVYGSMDNGSTYFALPLITIAANTNAQNLIRVLSVSLSSNTSSMVAVEPVFCNLTHIAAQYTETTDGTATVAFLIDEETSS